MLLTIFWILLIAGAACAAAGISIAGAPLRRIRNIPVCTLQKPAETKSQITDHTPSEDNQEEAISTEETEPSAISADTDRYPMVSVIVQAAKDESLLEGYLDAVFEQDYPHFEVIVVCESSAEATAMMTEKYAGYPHLYFTFIPTGSHNLSRRKLLITIGMKAAKGEIALLTASNAIIPSRSWIREMASPFIDDAGIQLALGVTHMNYRELRAPARWYREFDMVCDTAYWLSYALDGTPYRGDGYNMAIRRSCFFDHKGFAQTINLESGDDDLFVNEIADSRNTVVVYSDTSMLTMQWGHAAARMYKIRKEHYGFTARWLPKRPFLQRGWMGTSHWCASLLLIAATILPLIPLIGTVTKCEHLQALGSAADPAWWWCFIPFIILIGYTIAEIYTYRPAAKALKAVRLWWSVPLFTLWHPIANTIFRLRHRHLRHKNFTWQRHKHK